MIIITGGTGALNGATTDHLLAHIPADGIAVVTRDPHRASHLADRGVEVRRGDYADPASLPAAFDGADQLLLVSSNDPFADAVALHRAAIDAAVDVGVGRILYTSHQGPRPTVRSVRPGIMRRRKNSWTAAVSRGRRCATGSTPTASAG